MFAFLDNGQPPSPIIRACERPRLDVCDAELCYELLSRNLNGQVMALLISVRPGGRRIAERLSKPTDEVMYVVRGRLSITIEDQTYALGPGDSISYEGRSLREFAASDGEELEVICCVTPPVL
jgi:quercetin dioxygenase-like cupin family protein